MEIKHEICNPKATCHSESSEWLTENTEQAPYLLHVPNVKDKIGIHWLQINKTHVQMKHFTFGI